MADFDAYYPKLLKYEGGYASAAYAAKNGDKGGETYLGIARNYNPDWAGWKLIDDYKKAHGEPSYNSHIPSAQLDQLAKEQSKKIYWDKLHLDDVKNQSLAEYIMDFGFNSGLGTPIKAVQGYLGITQDGAVGPTTLSKINAADPKKLFDYLQNYRINFVSNIKSLNQNMIQGLINRAKSFTFSAVEIVKKKPVMVISVTILTIGILVGSYILYNKIKNE